jgi:hypothetical protein
MKPDKTEDCTLPTSKDMCLCNIRNIAFVNYTIDIGRYVEKFNSCVRMCV